MAERVDFYVLNSALPKQRWLLACRLAEKAYLNDLKVAILQCDMTDAAALDELLWTYSERSFVPHELCSNDRFDPGAPVYIGIDAGSLPAADLLLNLTDSLPPGLDRYRRIAEIIDSDPERRRLGRERFKSYRELHFALDTHQLDDIAKHPNYG